jgi:hypothetical protein
MFLIVGLDKIREAKPLPPSRCESCHRNDAPKEMVTTYGKFKFFFIPLFSFAHRSFIECKACGAKLDESGKPLPEKKIGKPLLNFFLAFVVPILLIPLTWILTLVFAQLLFQYILGQGTAGYLSISGYASAGGCGLGIALAVLYFVTLKFVYKKF